MAPYQPAQWRDRPATPSGPQRGLLSHSSFPGPPVVGRSLLPAPAGEPGEPNNADQEAWAQMMRERQALRQANDEFEKNYWWMSLPAFAPVATVGALEGAGAVAAPFLARQALKEGPLNFRGKEFRLYAGDNRFARAGRAADTALNAKVKPKPGWASQEGRTGLDGARYRPDVATPRNRLIDQKPNTPSGRRAGARTKKKYESQLERPTRIIYYDPDDYL